jgi:hypothetical protein
LRIEGGRWRNGGVDGGSWNDVRTANGRAFGTQAIHSPPPYDDSVAILSGFAANHWCQGTLYNAGGTGSLEAELWLRGDITNGNIRGYEVDLYVLGGAMHLVCWHGALNDYLDLTGPSGITTNVSMAHGAVWYAEMVGTVITIKCNGLTVHTYDTVGDSIKFGDGNPGMGFYVDSVAAPTGNDLSLLGWDDYAAGSL